jgi:predicted glycosyltransferase
MRISYYCQHVLGIGHLHRSLEICNGISVEHDVTLILGGPKARIDTEGMEVLHLPGLKMDHNFQNMVPCTAGRLLEDVKRERKELLVDHFIHSQPDIFITELYPFGRKAFRFELEPVLSSIGDGTLPPCQCYCSVRDILVEKQRGREKFEKKVVKTLNDYFDGVLIHSDPSVITLDKTFGKIPEITIPLYYTGFVSRPRPSSSTPRIRRKLGLTADTQLIVASIGGGNVGGELLQGVLKAFDFFPDDKKLHLQLFCGPYSSHSLYEELLARSSENISVDIFSDIFPEWLEAADLSISMGGYNSCMNVLTAGVPALIYPFKQNREQKMRVLALGKMSSIRLITEEELSPEILKERITSMLLHPKAATAINLDGARQTLQQLNYWQKDKK